MGLHQDATNRRLDTKTRALRRRIWWSCIVRDTFASFSANRVPRMSDADFRVAPLTLDDFDWYEHREYTSTGIGKQSLDVQKQLAEICIQTAAICRIITRVLLAAYNVTSTGNIDILYFNSTPEQGRLEIEPTQLRHIEEEFQAWYNDLSPDVAHSSSIFAASLRHEQAPLVHRALLSILYYTGLIMIHRQRSSSSFAEGSPRNLVRDAANQVNKILFDIYAVDLMKDMPPTVISLLFPASMSHVLDMKSRHSGLRRRGAQRLEECKQALRELADGHLSAEWAVNFLKYVESKVSDAQKSITKAQRPDRMPARRQSTGESTQDYKEVQMLGRDSSSAGSVSNRASTSYARSTNLMPTFVGSTGADGSLDWAGLPNTWFDFPNARWDGTDLSRLEHDPMLIDFEGDIFREW